MIKTCLNIKYFEIKHEILYVKQKEIIFFQNQLLPKKIQKNIWKQFRSYTEKADSSLNTLPNELKINDVTYSDCQNSACKLNEYFASICDHFNSHWDPVDAPDMKKIDGVLSSHHISTLLSHI